jgi:crotonobetainyl-CoA:carnitine CoA-transferase CaiB-like acyl-CoA transferase
VIKVEPPGGEVMRGVLGAGSVNVLFELENRGKRSITVALDKPGAVEVVDSLLSNADILLTNLIAPRLRKYHLTPEEVRPRHPRLIFLSVTGYGLTGPDADRPGFDFAAFWARAGIMSVVGHPGQPPVLSRIAQGDHTTGINAVAAALAALRLRDLTGEGQTVEISLQNTGAYTIATDLARALVDHRQPPKMDRLAPGNPLFNSYPTSDGRWIMLVHMTPDPYWPKLCRAIDRSDWIRDERYANVRGRAEHGAALAAVIESVFGEHELAYWAETLDANGLIWAPMAELPEVVADPQLRAMGAFETIAHPAGSFETVGTPFTIRDADVRVRGAAPQAGEHTQEVLHELGVDEERVATWAAGGVFG